MAPRKVLLTGATGFVGGSVLSQVVSSIDLIGQIDVTALVRKQEQANLLAKNHIRAQVFNGLDDAAQLRQIAADYEIVLHCATGLHTGSAEALILGLGDAKEKTGKQTYFIHTTGTSNLANSTVADPDGTSRDFSDATDDIYAEDVRRDADLFYPQRRTDIVVVDTAEKLGVKAYLMMPPTIYGEGKGLFNTQSMQVPFTIQHAIDAKRAEYIGNGSGTLGYVHVADLAKLYELVVVKILEGEDIPSGKKGFYFSNTGEYTWKGVNEKIGTIGHRLGLLESATPASVTLDEAESRWGFGGDRLHLEINHGGRSKTTPKLAFDLGWEPQKTEKDWDAELEKAWGIVLAESAAKLATL